VFLNSFYQFKKQKDEAGIVLINVLYDVFLLLFFDNFKERQANNNVSLERNDLQNLPFFFNFLSDKKRVR
jgi:hypothetical protein